ncbi:MAG: hypothetical protein ABL900_08085 [Burkholderiaceae bacterium]
MKFWIAGVLAALTLTAFGVWAAQPQYLTVDHSTDMLMDATTAKAMWKKQLPTARLAKLYPPKKWGFASEVQGGFNASNTCLVTARAMLLPLRGKALAFVPEKSATAFDALPNATREQCRELARKKLEEAMQAVVATLVAT